MRRIFTLIFSLLISAATFGQAGLKINEVDYDQVNLDSAEYIELFNSGVNGVDLSLYTIVMINGNNGLATPYDTFALPQTVLAPGDFFVICGNGGFVPNCDLVLPAYSNIIQNGAPDAIAIVENGTGNIIDALSYEGSTAAPFTEGTGVDTLNSDGAPVSDLKSIGRFPDGTDSGNNSADFVRACSTPGQSNLGDTTTCSVSVPTIDRSFNSFTLFPNPTKGLTTIECIGLKDATISLRNVLGKEIKSVVVSSQESIVNIDLTSYPDGVYFIQIKSDAGESTRRIILRK